MALSIFVVFAEGHSDGAAFAIAQQNPVMAGRVRYELIDGSTSYPSDQSAFQRAEWTFGVQPQADKVYIAGEHTNTCWAIRVRTTTQGKKRLMFYGLHRPT
jgi:hypothetical protein